MVTYLAILRGINVSGQKKINMKELAALFTELGFGNVMTYIQSGNVLFTSVETEPEKLSKQIEQKILEKYEFEVPVLIRTKAQLLDIQKGNPFLVESGIYPEHLHVSFLSEEPVRANTDKLDGIPYAPDKFIVAGREVYVYCPNGYGRTKLNNTFFESKLKVTATTRNWKTVNELAILMAD